MSSEFQELYAVNSEDSFRFFFSSLFQVLNNKKRSFEEDELFYVSSILAHYTLDPINEFGSNGGLKNGLVDILDCFILGGYPLNDSQILEEGGSRVVLFAGFFREQMVRRHHLPFYDRIGQGLYYKVSKNSSDQNAIFSQPIAVMFYNNQRYDIPINCLYTNKQFYKFNVDGLDACIMLIPTINQQGQGNQWGSLLYISPEVKQTNFARLYLFGEESNNFKIVYNDEASIPLAVLEGRGLIGPLKIWKINYPKNMIYNKTYIGTELPDPSVMEV